MADDLPQDPPGDPRVHAAAEILARRRALRHGIHFDHLAAVQQAEMILYSLRQAEDFVAMLDAVQRFPLPPAARRG